MNPSPQIDRERVVAALCVAWTIALVACCYTGRWDVATAMLLSFGLGGAARRQ